MQDDASLSGKVAVAGVGNTAFGKFPEKDQYQLGAEAFTAALTDCGLDKSDIDGLLVCRLTSYARMGEVLGLNPRWTMILPGAGRMSAIAIIDAALALSSGQANYIALIYSNVGRSRGATYGGGDRASIWHPWGFTSPGASHAAMFRRHMEVYGTTSRQLAEVSVAIRSHACMNPDAVMRTPITIEEHQASREIVSPLHLFDYCLINDGAVCMIMTTAERARDLRKPPVLLRGFGSQDTFHRATIPNFDIDFWYEPARKATETSYRMANIKPSDVDALMAYDNFSPTVLFTLEGAGYCGRGESGGFVEGGTLRLGGTLPTNTDGGHLSNSYMQGWALNVEAVRQLRGECGERQVPCCEVVQYAQLTPCVRSIIYSK